MVDRIGARLLVAQKGGHKLRHAAADHTHLACNGTVYGARQPRVPTTFWARCAQVSSQTHTWSGGYIYHAGTRSKQRTTCGTAVLPPGPKQHRCGTNNTPHPGAHTHTHPLGSLLTRQRTAASHTTPNTVGGVFPYTKGKRMLPHPNRRKTHIRGAMV